MLSEANSARVIASTVKDSKAVQTEILEVKPLDTRHSKIPINASRKKLFADSTKDLELRLLRMEQEKSEAETRAQEADLKVRASGFSYYSNSTRAFKRRTAF